GMIISSNEKSINLSSDSTNVQIEGVPKSTKDYFFRMLYGVDSLQDTLKLQEIETAYSRALEKQNVKIPFNVIRLDSSNEDDDPGFNKVTIGFAHPVTYQLNLGNTFGYLFKRLLNPILF